MKIKRLMAVVLTLLIVALSIPVSAAAVTPGGDPECYLVGFDSSQWSITNNKDTVLITEDGEITSSANNAFELKYTGAKFDLSNGFALQFSTCLQGDYIKSWGNVSYLYMGGFFFRIANMSSNAQPVRYSIEYQGVTYSFNSGKYMINDEPAPEESLAYVDTLFTLKYHDGKLSLYNERIKSDENPDGIITWSAPGGGTTTEIEIDPDSLKETGISIHKDWCGPNYEHTVFGDLFLCDYEYFGQEKPVFTKETQVNIACIGDSITYGVGTYSGYRYYLFEKLYNEGCKFHFVGPYTSSDPRLPGAYSRHCGYSGAVIGPNKNSGSRSSYDFLDSYINGDAGLADIALVMLGHNNYFQNIDEDNIGEVYENFLKRIFEINPDITVYAATMVNGWKGVAPDEADGYIENGLNALLPGIVDEMQTDGYDVRFLDLKTITNLHYDTDDFTLGDGVHPNEHGQQKIADAWYDAIVGQVKEMNEKGEGSYNAVIKPVTDISLDKKSMTLNAGGYLKRINAYIQISSATVSTVKWSSSDESVATVSVTGVVTPVSEGNCTITATTLDGGYTDSCEITVLPEETDKTELTNVLDDTFSMPSKWTGDTSRLGDSALYLWFPGSGVTTQFESVRHFKVDEEFKLYCSYVCTGNENNFYNNYTSYSFAGIEMRLYDAAKTVELRFNGESIGKWTTGFEVNTHNYEMYYKNGTVYAIRDNEIVVQADIPYSELPETSPVGIYSGEFYRYAVLYNVCLDTLSSESDFVDISVVDTHDKTGFDSIESGFNDGSWTVVSPSEAAVAVADNAIKSSSANAIYADYTGDAVDLSNGFELKVTTELASPGGSNVKYWGASGYISVGKVALRIQNARDYNQSRRHPAAIYVYTDAVFDETSGSMTSGTLAGALYTKANGTANVVSEDVLKYLNAEYTLYYDGANLYIKNGNIGTLKFEKADGSFGTAIPVDPDQFSRSSVHIYKESTGYSPSGLYPYFMNFSLTARDASVVVPDPIVGDITGDNSLDSQDLLYLTQYMLGIISVDNIFVCDFDSNSIIDARDIVIMQMAILGK